MSGVGSIAPDPQLNRPYSVLVAIRWMKHVVWRSDNGSATSAVQRAAILRYAFDASARPIALPRLLEVTLGKLCNKFEGTPQKSRCSTFCTAIEFPAP